MKRFYPLILIVAIAGLVVAAEFTTKQVVYSDDTTVDSLSGANSENSDAITLTQNDGTFPASVGVITKVAKGASGDMDTIHVNVDLEFSVDASNWYDYGTLVQVSDSSGTALSTQVNYTDVSSLPKMRYMRVVPTGTSALIDTVDVTNEVVLTY